MGMPLVTPTGARSEPSAAAKPRNVRTGPGGGWCGSAARRRRRLARRRDQLERCRHIRDGNRTVAIRIRPRATEHRSAVDVGSQIAIAIHQLGLKVSNIRKRHDAVAVGVARNGDWRGRGDTHHPADQNCYARRLSRPTSICCSPQHSKRRVTMPMPALRVNNTSGGARAIWGVRLAMVAGRELEKEDGPRKGGDNGKESEESSEENGSQKGVG